MTEEFRTFSWSIWKFEKQNFFIKIRVNLFFWNALIDFQMCPPKKSIKKHREFHKVSYHSRTILNDCFWSSLLPNILLEKKLLIVFWRWWRQYKCWLQTNLIYPHTRESRGRESNSINWERQSRCDRHKYRLNVIQQKTSVKTFRHGKIGIYGVHCRQNGLTWSN